MKNKILSLLMVAALSVTAVAQTLPSAPPPYVFAGTPVNGTNEVQTVTLTGFAAGTLSLKFSGQTATLVFLGSESNGDIDTAVNAALEALSEVGTGGVTVSTSGTTDRAIAITFTGRNAARNVPAMTGTVTGANVLSIAQTTAGVDATARGSATGRLLVDSTNGRLYQNTGTTTVPYWALTGQGGMLRTLTIPLTSLATGLSTSAIDLLTNYTVGYKFRVLKFDFVTTVAGTGTSASQVFNLEIGTTNVTGGVLTVTLASTDTIGEVTAGTAITAANSGSATDTLSIEMAASGTVFTAGAGYFVIEIQELP